MDYKLNIPTQLTISRQNPFIIVFMSLLSLIIGLISNKEDQGQGLHTIFSQYGADCEIMLRMQCHILSKKISNDQEPTQSDSTSCLQNQKGNN